MSFVNPTPDSELEAENKARAAQRTRENSLRSKHDCSHEKFMLKGNVSRLTDNDSGPVIGYAIDVSVKCIQCGLPFRFKGFPYGYSRDEPRLSADSLELRAPLEPAYTTEILGDPVQKGTA